jgi:arylsulfatase A-like enzyme
MIRSLCRIVVFLAVASPLARVAAAASKPNVVLVVTDDQGYGDFSCHGNPVLRTPNLDRLHSQSVRLTDFHVAPMCTPTRGQLMTGQDALRNGAMNVSSGRTLLRRGIPTMPEIFRANGYRTAMFGKWHLGDNYPYRPHDRGFEEALYFPSSHVSSAPDHWNNDYFDDVYRRNGKPETQKGYCTDVFFGAAERWIRGCARRGEPFFAYIATNAPHGPLFVPDRYREPYRDQPRNVATFFGMIANIDENMGKLDALLQELGARDDTLLIFMTDNGATAGAGVHNAGMRGRKIDLYDGGHRVPCFIRWPAGRLRPAGDVPELTGVQDLLPTLVDLLGLRAKAAFDGVSLAPLLRGEAFRFDDRILVIQFSRMNAPVPQRGDAAVLWRRYRLVGDRELYDLETDPAQAKDLLAERPEIAARMRRHYEAWWAGVAPRVNELGRIVVGTDFENPTLLSPADWQDVFLDQSAQVRRGEAKNGAWGIDVARGGTYEVELRRWPAEADAPLAAGMPAYKAADGEFPAGTALPIARAKLRVAGHGPASQPLGSKVRYASADHGLTSFEETRDVTAQDKSIRFAVALRPGPVQLQTWFYDAAGKELCGAYYVYVRRLK